MNYFLPKKHTGLPFITGYEIVDDKIVVSYYNSDIKETFPLTSESIKMIEDAMKGQVVSAYSSISEMQKNVRSNYGWLLYNAWFTFYNAYHLATVNNASRYVYASCLAGFIALNHLRLKNIINDNTNIDEIEKYKYFIENEDVINYEIKKRFMEECDDNLVIEALMPRISINDLDNTTLTELEEMVELIKGTYGEEMKLSLK